MAACTPAGGFDIAVLFQSYLPRFADAEEVRLIVKRAKVVCAMKPDLVRILMSLEAITIHHQRLGRNELSRGCAGEGRLKVFSAFG